MARRMNWGKVHQDNRMFRNGIAGDGARVDKAERYIERETAKQRWRRQVIEKGKSKKGGYTRKQLAEWGIAWPPLAGWKEHLIQNGFPSERR